jgi:recombinational DNA repair ATPase RecF
MSQAALKSLSLTAFRGSTTTFVLPFEKDRKLTLVYGENGTGKTTICDGLEFLAKGEVGSLNDKGLGKALEKHWPSAGKQLSDIVVALELRDDTNCSGRFVGKQAVFEPANARPKIELLRQQQIKALIETQAAKRYEELQRFIDVEGVERSEEALKNQIKELETEKANAENDESKQFATIHDQYEIAGKPAGQSALIWARALMATPVDGQAEELLALGVLTGAVGALASYPNLLNQRRQALAGAQNTFDETEKGLEAALNAASAAAAETVGLLEAGKSYFHLHPDVEVCPLCESAENVAGLAASIESRLAQLASVRDCRTAHDTSKRRLESAKASLAELDANFNDSVQEYTKAKAGHAWAATVAFPASNPPANMDGLPDWLGLAALQIEAWKNREAQLRQGDQQRQTIERVLARYEAARTRKENAQALVPQLEKAHEICVATRRAFTDAIMAEIAGKVGELYELVHKGEGANIIALQLDPNRRASLDLQARFGDKDVPPQAYYSQSHLDTLGLCVFLALRLRENPADTILILDDVLGSVDEPHVDRIVDMLYDVTHQFRHTFITTHYRPWREKYRWGRLRPDKLCQFVELIETGTKGVMAARNPKPEIEWLKKYLGQEEKDIQTICSKAGVILEEALDFLTWRYECRLPRREDAAYTLGELLDAVSGKLRANLRVEIIAVIDGSAAVQSELMLQPLVEELAGMAGIRNVIGAHFNKVGFILPNADAIRFANLVEQLAVALVCPDHGWPNNGKSGSYWTNGGNTRRLHPLKKPS